MKLATLGTPAGPGRLAIATLVVLGFWSVLSIERLLWLRSFELTADLLLQTLGTRGSIPEGNGFWPGTIDFLLDRGIWLVDRSQSSLHWHRKAAARHRPRCMQLLNLDHFWANLECAVADRLRSTLLQCLRG